MIGYPGAEGREAAERGECVSRRQHVLRVSGRQALQPKQSPSLFRCGHWGGTRWGREVRARCGGQAGDGQDGSEPEMVREANRSVAARAAAAPLRRGLLRGTGPPGLPLLLGHNTCAVLQLPAGPRVARQMGWEGAGRNDTSTVISPPLSPPRVQNCPWRFVHLVNACVIFFYYSTRDLFSCHRRME